MGEIRGSVPDDDFGDHSDLFEKGVLESGGVLGGGLGQRMPGHVEVTGGFELDGCEALVELPGFFDLVQKIPGDRLAGPVVLGVGLDHLGIGRPVLHDLGAELDEIAGDARPADRLVGHIGQEVLEGVAEFMEKRQGLLEGDQGRLVGRRLGEIADVVDDRRDAPAVLDRLHPDRARPGSAPLGRPRDVV